IALVSSGARTMQFSASVSILAAIVVGFLNSEERLTPGKILEALEAGARGAVTVAVACAMAGIIAGCITVTGLASILINGIVNLAGNATIIGLVLTMLCCIVLGMGVPTTANYCIMAATCAPILVQLGFNVVAAHFFVFYFGIVADITPPVALAAYAGSAIAKSDPMKTGITATKLAIAAFIVPYIFAYNPEMLFVDMSGAVVPNIGAMIFDVIVIGITALLGLFSVATALNGYLYCKVPAVLRLVLIAGGLCMMIPGLLTDVIGLVVLVAVVVYQYTHAKKINAAAV
ncbi:MAG: TRAP transporter large permease subunit, partial [Oscillospiraceae bacterium]|nr:TRAP transporter large permease subunit [Oscillospiraceae bacterium]